MCSVVAGAWRQPMITSARARWTAGCSQHCHKLEHQNDCASSYSESVCKIMHAAGETAAVSFRLAAAWSPSFEQRRRHCGAPRRCSRAVTHHTDACPSAPLPRMSSWRAAMKRGAKCDRLLSGTPWSVRMLQHRSPNQGRSKGPALAGDSSMLTTLKYAVVQLSHAHDGASVCCPDPLTRRPPRPTVRCRALLHRRYTAFTTII